MRRDLGLGVVFCSCSCPRCLRGTSPCEVCGVMQLVMEVTTFKTVGRRGKTASVLSAKNRFSGQLRRRVGTSTVSCALQNLFLSQTDVPYAARAAPPQICRIYPPHARPAPRLAWLLRCVYPLFFALAPNRRARAQRHRVSSNTLRAVVPAQ